tara:strand:- start:82 stop:207 length:126 start_codon:yes stop_codon:yes gene_type:complete
MSLLKHEPQAKAYKESIAVVASLIFHIQRAEHLNANFANRY